MAENSDKNVNSEEFRVGDVVRIDFSEKEGEFEVLVILGKIPKKDSEYYVTVDSNGTVTTIWKEIISGKVGFIDVEELIYKPLNKMSNDWIAKRR